MRKLTLDDVRISPWAINVVAAPLWAYEFEHGKFVINAEAWSDIREELHRRYQVQNSDGYPYRYRCCHLLHPDRAARAICRVCGEIFMAMRAGYTSVTCTEKCARIWRRQTHVQSQQPRSHVSHDVRLCPQCHESFTPRRSDAVYCSGRCRVAHHRQQMH
jgi:hypothetical protein